jgi:hypothetical protein
LHAPPPSPPRRGDRQRGGAAPKSSCSKPSPGSGLALADL